MIRRDPMVLHAYLGRAAAQGEKGEYDAAIAGLDQLIRIDPKLPDTYLVRAAGWKHKKQYDRAVADLTEAIRLDPRNAVGYHERGSLYGELKQFDQAIADYSMVIRLEPNVASCYCSRAFAFKAAKNFEKAIADYNEAIRLDPKDSDAYCGRGWVWHEMHQYAAALADFDQALRTAARDVCAIDGRAWIAATCPDASLRDGKKAVELAIEACELSRWKEAYCLETLAAAYAETGDFPSAVKWQTKAIELEADPKEKADYEGRLKLYQDKKPFREPGAESGVRERFSKSVRFGCRACRRAFLYRKRGVDIVSLTGEA